MFRVLIKSSDITLLLCIVAAKNLISELYILLPVVTIRKLPSGVILYVIDYEY